MLKSEIDGSINNIINTIETCGIVDVFKIALDSESETNTMEALKAYSKFLKTSQSFNAFENQLLEMFDLEQLRDAAIWSTILKPEAPGSKRNIKDAYSSIMFVQDHLPKILALRGADKEKVTSAIENGKSEGIEYVNLSVVVIEEEELSSPKRLVMMLEAIQGLYDVVGRLKNMPTQDLLVTSCDSGNDKKFDFLGSSEIIGGVREIILSLWDRVVFYREDKTGEHLKLLTESLPLLAKINELEKSGNLEKEEAEILRRRATSSVTKFSQAGLTIPEMEDVTRYDPRELMRPDRKSLAAPEAEPRVAADSGMAVVPDDEEDEDEYEEDGFEASPEPVGPVDVPTADEPEPVATPEEPTVQAETSTVDPFVGLDASPEPEIGAEPEVTPESEPQPAAEKNDEAMESAPEESAPEKPDVAEKPAEPEATLPGDGPVYSPAPEKTEVVDEIESAPVSGESEEPQVTVETDIPAAPEAPAKPEVSVEPEAPVVPEESSEPQVTVDSDIPAAPEAPAKPEVSVEPEAPVTPEEPGEPQVNAEPEISDAPDDSVEPEVAVEAEEPNELQVALEEEAEASQESADEVEADEPSPSPFGLDEEEESEVKSKMDTDMESIFERMAAGYKEMKRREDEAKKNAESSDKESTEE